MSEQEIAQWTEMLSRTVTGRIVIIREMLLHAAGDGMTSEDRRICRMALVKLEAQAARMRVH